ncbi:MAG TPA: DNA topoisomerase IV subunit A, partial [Candidatus Poseidoniales archaeon]|nr:DNA topoisomerase IV subunit A [Candidatus Poseidoniales archaeon]
GGRDGKGTMDALREVAMEMYERMALGEAPTMTLPVRTKSNIGFDEKTSVYTYKDKKTIRKGAELGSAKRLLKALHVIEFIDDMIRQGKTSTLREMYYISEGWGHGKFGNQSDSDNLAEDLEIVSKKLREDFRLRPEEDGSRMIGDVQIEELNRRGDWMQINCRNDVGDSGYGIPFNVDEHKLRLVGHNIQFILAIETGGMFDRLVENGFDEEHDALLIHTKGQPARSTRRIIKRMEEAWGVPVLVFADCDPYSFRIFASIAYGAIKTAHISHYLATPGAQYLGITTDDILEYELPTDDLSPEDIKQLKAELSDPRFEDVEWSKQIDLMLSIGKKAEQQSLAKYGLDFVTDTYLPAKLAEFGLT